VVFGECRGHSKSLWKMSDKSDEPKDQEEFEHFARIHPHEVNATYPDRFWDYFHRVNPDMTRGAMEEMLERTSK
jgi:hypothetical protein